MANGFLRASRSSCLAPTVMLFVESLGFTPNALEQSRGVPYDTSFGPSFYEKTHEHEFPGTYESIESVDFRNLSLDIANAGAKLKNGAWEHKDADGYRSVKLDSIHYLPSEDSHSRFALVLYTLFSVGGSSNTDGVAEIYELEGHRLKSVQQIGWDEHFDSDHPYVSFNEKSQTLMVRSAHYLPGDAHCCISGADVITLQWNGNRFIKKVVWVELSKSGEKAGKKL